MQLRSLSLYFSHLSRPVVPDLGSPGVFELQLPEAMPAQLVVKASGSCSPRTPWGSRLGTTGLDIFLLILYQPENRELSRT